MTTAVRVRRRPTEHDAIRFLGHKNATEVVEFCGTAGGRPFASYIQPRPKYQETIVLSGIRGPRNTVYVDVGVWILKDADGIPYPVDHDLFIRIYDIVGGDGELPL